MVANVGGNPKIRSRTNLGAGATGAHMGWMRVDPFDLSTWYHPGRAKPAPGGHMTREELATRFWRVSSSFQRAQASLKSRQKAVERSAEEKDHLNARLGNLISAQPAEPSDADAKAASETAIAFADAVARWRDSEVALRVAEAEAKTLFDEANSALEMLIASGR
jgi:hypothetical protein